MAKVVRNTFRLVGTRDPISEHAERKSDISGRRDGPSLQSGRAAPVQDSISDGRGDYATRRRDARESAVRPGRQLTIHEFPFDLEADNKKEQGH